MDFFDLQTEVKRDDADQQTETQDPVAETAMDDVQVSDAAEAETPDTDPVLEVAEQVDPTDMVLDALRDMSKTIRSKTKVLEQISEKEADLDKLTEELRGMLEGTVEQTDGRDDYAVAVERKKTETDLDRLRKRADPTVVKQQVSDTITALRAYLETIA